MEMCVLVCVVSAVVASAAVGSWCCMCCLCCCRYSNCGWNCFDAIGFDSDPIHDFDFDSILYSDSILD